jgi:hypothetical protein
VSLVKWVSLNLGANVLVVEGLGPAGNIPNTNKFNWYCAGERRLEPRRKGIVALTCGLEELVREWDLFHIVFGEQANLHGTKFI